MKQLKEYFDLQKKIYEYFGYKEDWVVIPLEDKTDSYWLLTGEESGGQVVYYDEELTEEVITAGSIYSAPIYTQRFLPKWVYRGAEYTMVCADTRCDGNKFLMVFDNTKECKDVDLIDVAKNYGLF